MTASVKQNRAWLWTLLVYLACTVALAIYWHLRMDTGWYPGMLGFYLVLPAVGFYSLLYLAAKQNLRVCCAMAVLFTAISFLLPCVLYRQVELHIYFLMTLAACLLGIIPGHLLRRRSIALKQAVPAWLRAVWPFLLCVAAQLVLYAGFHRPLQSTGPLFFHALFPALAFLCTLLLARTQDWSVCVFSTFLLAACLLGMAAGKLLSRPNPRTGF